MQLHEELQEDIKVLAPHSKKLPDDSGDDAEGCVMAFVACHFVLLSSGASWFIDDAESFLLGCLSLLRPGERVPIQYFGIQLLVYIGTKIEK